jgi:YgiT-type zinc finger domain-containing protein
MAKVKQPKFGGLPPKYGFMINPYPEERINRCPLCEKKARQRKTPLVIHVDPKHLIVLNYTCRYCPDCDLLIAHKHEIERCLAALFSQHDPDAIGNEYMVMGSIDKSVWRDGLKQQKNMNELLPQTSDFVKYHHELRFTKAGYYPAHLEPPVAEPPLSQEWIKN